MMKQIGCALCLALLFIASASAGSPAAVPADLSLPDMQGQQHSLTDYRGKILVVNFWATWCGPCKHEMPLFSDVLKHYGADRVKVVAVSLDDKTTQNNIAGFAEKQRMSFPILLGGPEAMKELGLGEALPETLFIDSTGQIVARIMGEVSKSELHDRLDFMLDLKKGKEPPALINNLNKKSNEPTVPMMR